MASVPKDVPLFRHEVMLHRNGARFGEVLFTKPRWMVRCGVAAILFSLAGGLTLLSASYTRRAQAEGWITLLPGHAVITAPKAGTIEDMAVADGTRVTKGQTLLSITSERSSESGLNIERSLLERLKQERAEVSRQLDLEDVISRASAQKLALQLGTLKAEIARLMELRSLTTQKLAIAKEDLERTRGIVAAKYLPRKALDDASNAALVAQIELSQSEQKLEEKKSLLESTLQLRNDLPVQLTKIQAGINERLAAIDQRVIEAESAGHLTVTSPVDGVVSGASMLSIGGSVAAGALLVTVIPDGASFRGEMLVPSSNAGFLKPGMEVWLRYDAFPFARFGQYRATLVGLDRTVIVPGTQVGPIVLKEPAYRAILELDSQKVSAYGDEFGLQSGLTFKAAVSTGSRKVIDMIFDPLLAAGRNIY